MPEVRNKSRCALRCALAVAVLAGGVTGEGAQVRRVRNEGTVSVDAANVTGSGNIIMFTGIDTRLRSFGLEALPRAGATVGLAGFLQFKGEGAFRNFRHFGPLQAHIQGTIPGNDRLRPFNLAVRGELYLSNAKDTISFTTDASKPDYTPFFSAAVLADIDWIALGRRIPLKTYVQAGLVDDPMVLHQFSQLSFVAGVEWKTMAHSFFADGGVVLFKERKSRINPQGDDAFEQYYCWVQPGVRYRIQDRFSIVGGVRATLLQRLKGGDPAHHPHPVLGGVSVRVELPLSYHATNTEAIRTLVLTERMSLQRESQPAGPQSSAAMRSLTDALPDIEGELFDTTDETEHDMIERRRALQEKMNEIERLLRETQ